MTVTWRTSRRTCEPKQANVPCTLRSYQAQCRLSNALVGCRRPCTWPSNFRTARAIRMQSRAPRPPTFPGIAQAVSFQLCALNGVLEHVLRGLRSCLVVGPCNGRGRTPPWMLLGYQTSYSAASCCALAPVSARDHPWHPSTFQFRRLGAAPFCAIISTTAKHTKHECYVPLPLRRLLRQVAVRSSPTTENRR